MYTELDSIWSMNENEQHFKLDDVDETKEHCPETNKVLQSFWNFNIQLLSSFFLFDKTKLPG